MNLRSFAPLGLLGSVGLAALAAACGSSEGSSETVGTNVSSESSINDVQELHNVSLGQAPDDGRDSVRQRIENGRDIFRYETFGDDFFWGGQLRLHEAILGRANGGVGKGLSPNQALAAGLKVDEAALPPELAQQIVQRGVDLDDPATTVALLKLDAIVGVVGIFDHGELARVGITCGLCHSTVDDHFAKGIGRRLDGWPNRDLNVGAVVAMAPDLSPFETALGVDRATVLTVLQSWGPGKYDAELVLDGKAFRPDGKSAATLIPPAFGQSGVNLHTYTGWGSTPYWNAYVAVTQMHGLGSFYDARLNDRVKFPLAVKNHLYDITSETDMVTDKLQDLHLYQLALSPPRTSLLALDKAAVKRGQALFEHKAQCASCHVPPAFTEPGWNMHTAEEIGIDDFQAMRSPDERYRTTPLGGMIARQKGGFYHDGRFATLMDVIDHYDDLLHLSLSRTEKRDLEAYVTSL